MSKLISSKQVKKNISFSLGAQVFSLMVGIIFSLIVPKSIPQLQYAYWQTYLLYAGYVGIMHFGLLDGIVLRYSQYDYEELDFARLRSQFQFLLLINLSAAFMVVLLAQSFLEGINQTIGYLVACSIVFKNIHTYTSFLFQLTNRIHCYAYLTIIHKIISLVIILGLLFTKSTYFIGFCLADIGADILGVCIMMRFNKGLYFGKAISLRDTISEALINIASGILLMAANWSAMLIVGSAKMIIQWNWDPIVFAKISFGFNITNLFLVFVSAISVVLFPTLKRLDTQKLPDLYIKIRQSISILFFILMIGYFPGGFILKLWLPKYADSVVFVGILLPLIIFSSKVGLLTNNYFKAYREEKKMCEVNFFSIVVAFASYMICAYMFHNLTAILVCIVLMIMMRSILSEIFVGKIINRKFYRDFICETIMCFAFILSARFFTLKTGFILYTLCVVIYSYLYRIEFKKLLGRILTI